VSVGNNLPGVGGDLLAGTEPSSEDSRIEELTNFEISKTVRNTVREVGEVKKLSVAVLVDGRYSTNEEGVQVYEARPEAELEQIRMLVQSAVGFDEDRGDRIEVINLQFADIDTNEGAIDEAQLYGFDKNKLLDVAEIVTVAIMIILVILLVLQPMVNKLMESGSRAGGASDDSLETQLLAASPLNPALTGPGGGGAGGNLEEEDSLINIHGVEGKVKASSLKKVEEIIDNYPAETLSVIRSWMAQE
jgi:flagellar M-ring protein FliF